MLGWRVTERAARIAWCELELFHNFHPPLKERAAKNKPDKSG